MKKNPLDPDIIGQLLGAKQWKGPSVVMRGFCLECKEHRYLLGTRVCMSCWEEANETRIQED